MVFTCFIGRSPWTLFNCIEEIKRLDFILHFVLSLLSVIPLVHYTFCLSNSTLCPLYIKSFLPLWFYLLPFYLLALGKPEVEFSRIKNYCAETGFRKASCRLSLQSQRNSTFVLNPSIKLSNNNRFRHNLSDL